MLCKGRSLRSSLRLGKPATWQRKAVRNRSQRQTKPEQGRMSQAMMTQKLKDLNTFLMESRVQGNLHARFGERGRGIHNEESLHRRSRLYSTREQCHTPPCLYRLLSSL